MPRYMIVYEVHASTTDEIDADSPELAIEKLDGRVEQPSLCSCCGENLQLDGIGKWLEVIEM